MLARDDWRGPQAHRKQHRRVHRREQRAGRHPLSRGRRGAALAGIKHRCRRHGAGDAFHGGFALALAEGQGEVEAMRFGAAVAGIKCTRLGGSAGTPKRSEVEALTAENRLSTPVP